MKIRTYPKEGDRRVLTRFAWFPVLIGNFNGGETIWLEQYKEVQVYECRYWERINWHRESAERINVC